MTLFESYLRGRPFFLVASAVPQNFACSFQPRFVTFPAFEMLRGSEALFAAQLLRHYPSFTERNDMFYCYVMLTAVDGTTARTLRYTPLKVLCTKRE
jgi:hypothetical protein